MLIKKLLLKEIFAVGSITAQMERNAKNIDVFLLMLQVPNKLHPNQLLLPLPLTQLKLPLPQLPLKLPQLLLPLKPPLPQKLQLLPLLKLQLYNLWPQLQKPLQLLQLLQPLRPQLLLQLPQLQKPLPQPQLLQLLKPQ